MSTHLHGRSVREMGMCAWVCVDVEGGGDKSGINEAILSVENRQEHPMMIHFGSPPSSENPWLPGGLAFV